MQACRLSVCTTPHVICLFTLVDMYQANTISSYHSRKLKLQCRDERRGEGGKETVQPLQRAKIAV